jgi:hypothetical protein
MKLAEPFISLGRLLSGRSVKKKKDWSSDEDQSGTFVEKMTPRWLKNELKDVVKFEIHPWRSLSPRFMRWFVRPQLGGKAFLRLSSGSKRPSHASSARTGNIRCD